MNLNTILMKDGIVLSDTDHLKKIKHLKVQIDTGGGHMVTQCWDNITLIRKSDGRLQFMTEDNVEVEVNYKYKFAIVEAISCAK